MAKKPSAVAISAARALLIVLKQQRKTKDDLQVEIKDTQDECLRSLRLVDPENRGVVVEVDGEKFAAFVQTGEMADTWDTQGLVEWLREHDLLRGVQTLVLDPKKLESEIEAGNIPKTEIQRFVIKGKPKEPYVRFGRPNKDSIQ